MGSEAHPVHVRCTHVSRVFPPYACRTSTGPRASGCCTHKEGLAVGLGVLGRDRKALATRGPEQPIWYRVGAVGAWDTGGPARQVGWGAEVVTCRVLGSSPGGRRVRSSVGLRRQRCLLSPPGAVADGQAGRLPWRQWLSFRCHPHQMTDSSALLSGPVGTASPSWPAMSWCLVAAQRGLLGAVWARNRVLSSAGNRR